VVAEAWAAWREEVAFAEQFTADHDLGFAGRDSEGEPISLRELLVDMIEEYARHNGHADLLRERIDGASANNNRGTPVHENLGAPAHRA